MTAARRIQAVVAEELESVKLVQKMDTSFIGIQRYVEEAGLEILDWRESECVDAVVVVKVVKRSV